MIFIPGQKLIIFIKTILMDLSGIRNPTLVLNRDIAVANINRMRSKCNVAGVRFRPHFKTHQSHLVGSWFRDQGVTEITVSSSLMAAYFIDSGWDDITIAFPYNPREHDYLEYLSRRARIALTIPGVNSAAILAEKCRSDFDVMVKIDTGYGRSGMQWNDVDGARKIVDILATNSCLKFRGLLTHAGNTYGVSNRDDVISIYNESILRMNYLKEEAELKGVIISSGDTPSATVISDPGMVDELRPGNFVFYDLMQYLSGICSFEDIAVAMACPVVDTQPSRGIMVIHGGAVHLSKDYVIIDNNRVFGMAVKISPDGWAPFNSPCYLTSLSQEHGIISMPARLIAEFRPGDLVGVIPVHSCLTADLAGGYILTDGTEADHMKERKYNQKQF